ncbi:uncharacterized protein LOC144088767 [Stigmatopora argus]
MALSQVQCMDDNHVNPRINETKPDFFYSEDQRLALEVLLRDGRDSFVKFVEDRKMRSFLSDLEQETLTKALEPYDPGLELFPEDAEENEPPLSSHYWPELSDMSIPRMDLGWPHTESYRGVTRTTVYTQPPLEGQTHIKEIVRKMIAHAQKVIAVVMDVFTDVDIFKDLIHAGFRRKVSIYILVESASLPHFLSMCQRANMHPGHLKNLRVRCTSGTEFHTRSCTVVKGRLGHRFMFIDGDKAVSGSFSFTWTSSRLDKNLVTVVTGQAVEAFDHLFRHLYATSRFVDLQQVTTEPEPEPETHHHLAPVVLPSSTIDRKLYNPKYALLIGDGANAITPADSSKEPQTPEVPDTKKRRRGRGSREPVQEEDPMHPGLINLEKAYLIPYLPTWPEPDPSSDVIGFINTVDAHKPTQVHLQRSERFETSQAIRFRNPMAVSNEPVPLVAKPIETSSKMEEKLNASPSQVSHEAKETVFERIESISTKVEEPEHHSAASRLANNAANSHDTEQSVHSAELTSPNKGQTTKDLSAFSSNMEHNQNSGKIEPPYEQKNKAPPKIGTSSSAVTGTSYLSHPAHSNSETELAATKTPPLLMQDKRHSDIPSKSSLKTHSLETSRPTSSSCSSSKTYTPEPLANHQAINNSNISKGVGAQNISTSNRLNTLTTDKSTGENKQQTVSKMSKNRESESGKTDTFTKIQQQKQKETSAGRPNENVVGLPDAKGRNALATLATNRDCLNIEEKISDDAKTPVEVDGSAKPQQDPLLATGKAGMTATLKQFADPKPTENLNKKESEKKTYHVKENKPQKISYSLTSSLTMWERIQAAMDEPSSKGATTAQSSYNTTSLTRKNIRRVSQEHPHSTKEQSPPHTPKKAQHVNNPDTALSPGKQSRLSSSGRRISGGTPSLDSPAVTSDIRTPSATTSLFTDYSAYVALFDNKDKNTSSRETQRPGQKVKIKDKEDVKSMDSGIKKTAKKDSKEKVGRNDVESKQKTYEKEKETHSPAPIKNSRSPGTAGPSNGDNIDAREVADQKPLPKATKLQRHPLIPSQPQ